MPRTIEKVYAKIEGSIQNIGDAEMLPDPPTPFVIVERKDLLASYPVARMVNPPHEEFVIFKMKVGRRTLRFNINLLARGVLLEVKEGKYPELIEVTRVTEVLWHSVH